MSFNKNKNHKDLSRKTELLKEQKYSHINSQNWSFAQNSLSVIISRVKEERSFFQIRIASLTLLTMTAEFMSSKCSVLRIFVDFWVFTL